MPVIVTDDGWARWLDPSPPDRGELLGLLQPTDDVALRVYPVRRLVNDVRQDGPDLIVPLAGQADSTGALVS